MNKARSFTDIRGLLGEFIAMDEILGSFQIDESKSLHLGILSPSSITELDSEELGFDGYFLFETDDNAQSKGIKVLGKAPNLDAAFRLLDIWQSGMAKVA